jgi:hypothetical protein
MNPGIVVILNDMNEDKKNKTKLLEKTCEGQKMFLLKQEEVHLREGEVSLKEEGNSP